MTAPAAAQKTQSLAPTPSQSEGDDSFIWRHLGPRPADVTAMLQSLGYSSLEELTAATVPASIRLKSPLNIGPPQSESQTLAQLRALANQNKVYRSFIGMGYYGTITPPVIQRNILENPGWYTQYTPYQAEISQGRLEALLNFQTMVADLTALPMANASLLDEATAAAEAMAMCHSINDSGDEAPKKTFFISQNCHPQTIAVVQARAQALGITTQVADEQTLLGPHSVLNTYSGILVQYPTTDGRILDYSLLTDAVHAQHALLVAATDLLALTLITPPGEWGSGENRGADIAIGSAQRFGVPMGYGGPHAAFMATKPQYVRKMPGRIVGVSKDAAGNPAYRLALQTREQHIRREKATSNICTAQVLLAIMASMYAVYHGPKGLKAIATRVHSLTKKLAAALQHHGHEISNDQFFDTIKVRVHGGKAAADSLADLLAKSGGANVRNFGDGTLGVSFDESTTYQDVEHLWLCFAMSGTNLGNPPTHILSNSSFEFDSNFEFRHSLFLTHPTFNSYHSEHEMLRYIKRLESRDLSLCQSMIPLGSCTMKLNATAEMFPITWPEFAHLHPFAPLDQTQGYQKLFATLEQWLANITGFAAVSLQPNAGSQGEYAGLLVIRAYHESQAKTQNAKLKTQNQNPEPGTRNPEPAPRDICLIPTSAHGTNPASAVVAGLKVIPVECDSQGNIDVADLRAKAAEHRDHLSCIMVTYPSTHGVFEESIREICQIVHDHGGQVYMDGANMNAQVGLTSPGEIGADVCHLNLHKTFCIPHGGGGPGIGPICVAKHLAPYLPTHPVTPPIPNTPDPIPPVSAASWGSAAILPIPYAYIAMMGSRGLTLATQVAILNANYMAKRLEGHYPVVFKGKNGRCAHEFIIDCRHFEASAGIKVEDIAKRLMDYGFHAPTMSWPEPGTLMIEPTESESKQELDRLCDALISIRQEIRDLEEGRGDKKDNVLKNAPHTVHTISKDNWPHPYSRQAAAFPVPGLLQYKFWPPVSRIDNPYGDRNLFCSCPPLNP